MLLNAPSIHWGNAHFLWTLKLRSSSLLVFPLRFPKIQMHCDEELYRQAYFLLLPKDFGLGMSWLPNIIIRSFSAVVHAYFM